MSSSKPSAGKTTINTAVDIHCNSLSTVRVNCQLVANMYPLGQLTSIVLFVILTLQPSKHKNIFGLISHCIKQWFLTVKYPQYCTFCLSLSSMGESDIGRHTKCTVLGVLHGEV